jgi:uncharacterized protein YbaA (DUF1428 family)
MTYVKASGTTVIEYPYGTAKLRADNPNVSFPKEPSVELLAEYGVFPVLPTAQPTPGEYERAAEALPVFSEGAWRQAWTLVAATAPARIKSLQFRREVRARNRKTQFLNWLATASEDVQEYFEFTDIIRMTDPEFQAFAAAQNFTQQGIDQFFIAAAKR